MLLVSHDRAFLDNVVTSTIVLEGRGIVSEYVGGYSDWLRQQSAGGGRATRNGKAHVRRMRPRKQQSCNRCGQRNSSFKDARELEQLPARIEKLERDIAARSQAMQDPTFFRQDNAAILTANAALAELQAQLDSAYLRWQALDG